jgi:hypothetical protein
VGVRPGAVRRRRRPAPGDHRLSRPGARGGRG